MPEKEACTKRRCIITEADLPLSCPQDQERLWDAHPKVYLALVDGEVTCPYCNTHYILDGRPIA